MIEVRIRTTEESGSLHLCTWPSTDLDDVIPAIKAWGVFDQRTADSYGAGDDLLLSAQIVIGEQQAFYEVVIHPDEGDA